jgi:hypothetical protein
MTGAATSCTRRCATTSCTVCCHRIRERASLGSASMAFPNRSPRWKRRKSKIGFGLWNVFSKENRYRVSPILWAIADVGVYKWIERSRVANVEVPWPEDRSRRPHANPRSCSAEMVEAIKLARLHLHNQGLFCGAQAIVWELEEMGLEDHPSVHTINRILNREELTHRRTGLLQSPYGLLP